MYKGMLGLAAVFMLMIGMQSISYAVAPPFAMRMDLPSTPGMDVEVFDNQPGDNNPAIGVILVDGPLGNWLVSVSTGITYPILGSTTAPQMDLNSVDVSSSLGDSLKIYLSAQGYMAPAGGGLFEIGGTTAGTLVAQSYWDSGNALFAETAAIGGPLTFNPGAFSGVAGGLVPAAGPYSLTIEVDVTHAGAGATSFDGNLRVPEPTSMLLLGFGLVGLFGLRRRV